MAKNKRPANDPLAPAAVPSPSSQTSTLLSAGVQIINSTDIAAIFAMFVKTFLHNFLEHTGRYFLFPINALLDAVEAGLAWYDAYKAHPQARTRAIVRASVASLFALAITTTVIVALTVIAAGPFIPFIFASALGLKSLYHGGASLYFTYKALNGADPNNTYKALAKSHGMLALTGSLATLAVLTVMAFAHFKLAPLGIAAGAGGVGLGIYRAYTGVKAILNRRAQERLPNGAHTEPAPLEQSATILKRLGVETNKNPVRKNSATRALLSDSDKENKKEKNIRELAPSREPESPRTSPSRRRSA